MLCAKQAGVKYHFWLFGMTQPGIEPRSPGPLAKILIIMPVYIYIYIYIYIVAIEKGLRPASLYIYIYIYIPTEKNLSRFHLTKEIVDRNYILFIKRPRERIKLEKIC